MLMLLLLLLLLWPGVGTSPAAFITPHRRANQNPLAAAAAPSTAVTLGSRAQLRVCPSMWRPFFPHSLASSSSLPPPSLSLDHSLLRVYNAICFLRSIELNC